MPKKWCFWTVVLEKTLESPLDCKEIKSVNPKWIQSWIFIGRTDADAEAPILWPPDANNWLTGEDPDPGKDWRQEEKGTTEDEIIGWHHWLSGHEFEQALGVGDGQGSLARCSPLGCKESDTTERLHWTNTILGSLIFFFSFIFISWRLITLQYCSGFCHTSTWISHGFTCIPRPDPSSHLPLHPIPLGLPSGSLILTVLPPQQHSSIILRDSILSNKHGVISVSLGETLKHFNSK